MTTKKITAADKKLHAALAQIAAEQAEWRSIRRLPEPPPKEAATLALCRWIGENCYNRHEGRAARH